MEAMRHRLLELLEPEIGAMGYELVDVEFGAGGGSSRVRLFIDHSGGVTLSDCERVSHQVSALLDVEDPIPGQYVLEVSSPGLNRTLRTREHFERYVGSRVKVQLKSLQGGRKRFTGELSGIDDEVVTLEVDGQAVKLPREEIQKAKLAPEF